jgi:hypothetical protein
MYIIDFEASSLGPDSYPIEVAWGSSPEKVTAFLLNPAKMPGWTDWSAKSFEFHGIRREELCMCGEDPRRVAEVMVRELAGKTVYSDEPRFDNRWKDRLLSAAGLDPSLVRIKNLKYYLNKMIREQSPCKRFVDLFQEFSIKKSVRHRAGADVIWLFEFVEFVRKLYPENVTHHPDCQFKIP